VLAVIIKKQKDTMIKRDYYSVRTGKKNPDQQVDFEVLKKIFLITYTKIRNEEYFIKYLGEDSDLGYISGELGNVKDILYVNFRKENLYPVEECINEYSEEDFFDIVEFLHDHCSKISHGYFYNADSNSHYFREFDDLEGRKYFRKLLNPVFGKYKDGFEISENGEILMLVDNGLSTLFEAEIPTSDEENIRNKMDAAILKFRRYKSTLEDRREAIRELADVLEFLRPTIKEHLKKKDENDIFNIANNFGIRHHNSEQQTDYDKEIWYSWIYYFYLATLHAVLRMTKNQ
jgi:hypothetical protein